MSGYLARLAARAGGAPAAAEPRLPSRFEPVDGSTDAASPAPVATPPGAPPPAALRDVERPADTPASVRRTDLARAEGDRMTAAPADRRDHGRDAPRAESAAVTLAPTPTALEASAAVQPGGPAVAHPPTPALSPAAPRVAHPPTLPISPAAPRVEATPPRRARPPAVTAPAVGTSERGEASVPSSEPDVVHVTIGRIEVRATVAPPAPARGARPARDPERSLHDYLAGRPR